MRIVRIALMVLLGALLFVALSAAILLQRVNSTLLDPDFYQAELRKADAYRFVMTDVLTLAVDEALEGGTESGARGENPISMLELETGDVVSLVNTSFTPAWLQANVEEGLHEVLPYATGRTDEFQVTVELRDQVAGVLAGVGPLLRRSGAYDVLMERMVDPGVEKIASSGLPGGINVPPERLRSAIRAFAPESWVLDQGEAAIREMTPYVLGDADSFTVTISLNGRVPVLADELKAVLSESGAYDALYSQVIEPAIVDAIGGAIHLPFGIELDRQELADAIREVAPPSWVQSQFEMVIDDALPYLTGDSESFASTISLVENKATATRLIQETATERVTNALEAMPACEEALSLEDVIRGLNGEYRGCVPPGVSREEMARVVSEEVSLLVVPLVEQRVPDTVVLTDADLRTTLAQLGASDSADQLDRIREVLSRGITFTEADLHRQVNGQSGSNGESPVGKLVEARGVIASGWTFTEADLKERMASSPDNADSTAQFERMRSVLHWLGRLPLLLFAICGLILGAIALLGGRTWSSRIAWASGALAVVSFPVYAIWGPVYTFIARPRLIEALSAASGAPGADGPRAMALMSGKIVEIAASAMDSFASGIALMSVVILLGSLAAFAASYYWTSLQAAFAWIKPRLRAVRLWQPH